MSDSNSPLPKLVGPDKKYSPENPLKKYKVDPDSPHSDALPSKITFETFAQPTTSEKSLSQVSHVSPKSRLGPVFDLDQKSPSKEQKK